MPEPELILAQALLEKKTMEWLARRAAELKGVRLATFTSERSARGTRNIVSYTEILKAYDATYVKLLLSRVEKSRRLRDVLWEPSFGTDWRGTPGLGLYRVVLIAGPEDDLTPKEVEQACNAGYLTVGLGAPELATEAMSLYALSCLHNLLL